MSPDPVATRDLWCEWHGSSGGMAVLWSLWRPGICGVSGTFATIGFFALFLWRPGICGVSGTTGEGSPDASTCGDPGSVV